jgi:hypothetical protein
MKGISVVNPEGLRGWISGADGNGVIFASVGFGSKVHSMADSLDLRLTLPILDSWQSMAILP